MRQELQVIVEQELEALQLELVELRRAGSKTRPVLDVRIDRKDHASVTVDDCARASRAIEARLESEQLVGERYVLEVSSPGVERPLRSAAEWRRFTGSSASVTSDALGGRAEVEIAGVSGSEGDESVRLRKKSGEEVEIPLAAVRDARLAFNWKR